MKLEEASKIIKSYCQEERLEKFLNSRRGEVFTSREMADRLGLNQISLRRPLRFLRNKKKIASIGNPHHFLLYGTKEAIAKLRRISE